MTIDEEVKLPGDLIATFARCANYPRTDQAALIFLAQGLRKASDATGIAMELIVDRCAETSQYCPTDAELLSAGRLIAEEIRRKQEAARNLDAELRQQYGPPKPWKPEPVAVARSESYHIRQAVMMQHIGRHLKVEKHNWRNVSWLDIFEAAKKLGYDWQTAEISAERRAEIQKQIDAELRKRRTPVAAGDQ